MDEGVVLAMTDFIKMTLEKFHEDLRPKCANSAIFEKSFVVDQSHIARRAKDEKSSVRENVGNEQIASIVANGRLNLEASEMNGTLREIAVEGKFLDFPWTDGEGDYVESVMPFRVVVREGSRKNRVVTLYDLRKPGSCDPSLLLEVSYEIW